MKRIIFPLDVPTKEEAEKYIKILKEEVSIFKVGLELFFATGILWIKELSQKYNIEIFLDVKLHDIPVTVSRAVKNILKNFKPKFITVHVDESEQFKKFVYEETNYNGYLGVTLLTSLDKKDLLNLYVKEDISIEKYVLKKVEIAINAGCIGIVCSAKEAKIVRDKFGDKIKIITPGIRLSPSKNVDDQKRVLTPVEAIKNGADFLVIGRPIRDTDNPLEVCKKINQEIGNL